VTFNRSGCAGCLGSTPVAMVFTGQSRSSFCRRPQDADGGCDNGWLQECPDPITNRWDKTRSWSARVAKELGIDPKGALIQCPKEENEFTIGKEKPTVETRGGQEDRGPVHIQPGLSTTPVIVPLEGGPTDAIVGKGPDSMAIPCAPAVRCIP